MKARLHEHPLFLKPACQIRKECQAPSGAHYGDLSSYRPPHYGNHTPVEIRTLRPERAIFLRHTGPYDRVSDRVRRLAARQRP